MYYDGLRGGKVLLDAAGAKDERPTLVFEFFARASLFLKPSAADTGDHLTLNDGDDRPLVIDQREENIDPQSVYDELVPLFQAAKRRRQVIMVTDNADHDGWKVSEAFALIDAATEQIVFSLDFPQK